MASAATADGINMRFLYDAHRKLFGVGYAVGGPAILQPLRSAGE